MKKNLETKSLIFPLFFAVLSYVVISSIKEYRKSSKESDIYQFYAPMIEKTCANQGENCKVNLKAELALCINAARSIGVRGMVYYSSHEVDECFGKFIKGG